MNYENKSRRFWHSHPLRFFKKGDETDIYFNYFKGLSLKATGNKVAADQIFTDIININFAAWDLAIVKKLAQKQLGEA